MVPPTRDADAAHGLDRPSLGMDCCSGTRVACGHHPDPPRPSLLARRCRGIRSLPASDGGSVMDGDQAMDGDPAMGSAAAPPLPLPSDSSESYETTRWRCQEGNEHPKHCGRKRLHAQENQA